MKIETPILAAIGLGLAIFLLLILLRPIPDWPAERVQGFAVDSCRDWASRAAPAPVEGSNPGEVSAIEFRGNRIGDRHRLSLDGGAAIELEVIAPGGTPRRFVASYFDRHDNPRLLVALDGACDLQVARRIDYDDDRALALVTLDAGLAAVGEPEWLNPPLEFQPRDPATPGLRVGMVDSGVNYRLPQINRRLARDDRGELLGYDFWDMDDLPYDAHPLDSGFFIQRHGTRTASVLLREAPSAELVPYRYPRPDMSRMRDLVAHAVDHGVEILGMPLGGNLAEEWQAFERAARAQPQMLFVVSAGNNGRDIDAQPVYPAALDLDNMIVVTSADDYLRPAERTNWGRESVDFMVPAENIDALDFTGEAIHVSGSSYAVARVTALAARIKAAQPGLDAAAIVDEIRREWSLSNETTRRWVGSGYIADPLAGEPVVRRPLPAPAIVASNGRELLPLGIELLVLDAHWSEPRIAEILQSAYDILSQCGIGPGPVSVYAVDAADYLRDLSTGHARTLLEAAAGDGLTVVLARDTRMLAAFTGEAFGLANTGMRPWLANSVWLVPDVDDPGVALAHEIYHVLANNGDHVEGVANLMQGRTRPDSTGLTAGQCELARDTGLANRLLQPPPP